MSQSYASLYPLYVRYGPLPWDTFQVRYPLSWGTHPFLLEGRYPQGDVPPSGDDSPHEILPTLTPTNVMYFVQQMRYLLLSYMYPPIGSIPPHPERIYPYIAEVPPFQIRYSPTPQVRYFPVSFRSDIPSSGEVPPRWGPLRWGPLRWRTHPHIR